MPFYSKLQNMKAKRNNILTTTFLITIHFLALILFGGIYEAITGFEKSNLSLAYQQNGSEKPEALNFSPLKPESEFKTTLNSPVDFLGSIALYFKPLQEINDGKPNGHFSILITVYDQTNNKYLINNEYEVFHDKETVLEYPFGFPNQKNSRGNKYQITIKPLIKNGIDPSFMGLALQNNEPVVVARYHIPANLIKDSLYQTVNLATLKIYKNLSSYMLLLFIFIFNSLLIDKFIKNKKFSTLKNAFLTNTFLLALNGILYTNKPNLLMSRLLNTASAYILFSCLFFGLIFIIYNETNLFKTKS